MELYIFDRSLNFKGIIDQFISLQWTRRYGKSGEFELHVALTTDVLNLLTKESLIYKKGDTEAGIILYRNLKQDVNGKEVLVLKGEFLTGYLKRRIIWGTEILTTTTELAMRTIVKDNCVTPSDNNRIISNLILGTLNNWTPSVNYQVSYANLYDELVNLSDVSKLGFRINFNITSESLIFDVYQGLNRSVNQSINPICIFSKEFENVLEQEYVDSLMSYKNLCLVGGIGEGSDRKLITVGSTIGLDRYEIFNDQKSLSNKVNDVVMSDSDYNNLLIGKGNETLSSNLEIQTFTSKINLNSNLKYKVDFDLGDTVTTIANKWGVTLDSIITEIQEVYEENGLSINITFGNNIPTLITKIKQLIN